MCVVLQSACTPYVPIMRDFESEMPRIPALHLNTAGLSSSPVPPRPAVLISTSPAHFVLGKHDAACVAALSQFWTLSSLR